MDFWKTTIPFNSPFWRELDSSDIATLQFAELKSLNYQNYVTLVQRLCSNIILYSQHPRFPDKDYTTAKSRTYFTLSNTAVDFMDPINDDMFIFWRTKLSTQIAASPASVEATAETMDSPGVASEIVQDDCSITVNINYVAAETSAFAVASSVVPQIASSNCVRDLGTNSMFACSQSLFTNGFTINGPPDETETGSDTDPDFDVKGFTIEPWDVEASSVANNFNKVSVSRFVDKSLKRPKFSRAFYQSPEKEHALPFFMCSCFDEFKYIARESYPDHDSYKAHCLALSRRLVTSVAHRTSAFAAIDDTIEAYGTFEWFASDYHSPALVHRICCYSLDISGSRESGCRDQHVVVPLSFGAIIVISWEMLKKSTPFLERFCTKRLSILAEIPSNIVVTSSVLVATSKQFMDKSQLKLVHMMLSDMASTEDVVSNSKESVNRSLFYVSEHEDDDVSYDTFILHTISPDIITSSHKYKRLDHDTKMIVFDWIGNLSLEATSTEKMVTSSLGIVRLWPQLAYVHRVVDILATAMSEYDFAEKSIMRNLKNFKSSAIDCDLESFIDSPCNRPNVVEKLPMGSMVFCEHPGARSLKAISTSSKDYTPELHSCSFHMTNDTQQWYQKHVKSLLETGDIYNELSADFLNTLRIVRERDPNDRDFVRRCKRKCIRDCFCTVDALEPADDSETIEIVQESTKNSSKWLEESQKLLDLVK